MGRLRAIVRDIENALANVISIVTCGVCCGGRRRVSRTRI